MSIEQEDTRPLLRKFIAAKDQLDVIKKNNDSDAYRVVEEVINEVGRLVAECNDGIQKLFAKEEVNDVSVFIASVGENSEANKVSARNGTLMRFLIPHTGKILETRGHNNKELKALKKEYGAEKVMGWRIR